MEEEKRGGEFVLLAFRTCSKEVVSCVTSGGGMIGWNFLDFWIRISF